VQRILDNLVCAIAPLWIAFCLYSGTWAHDRYRAAALRKKLHKILEKNRAATASPRIIAPWHNPDRKGQ
jgi:hypothetical protein